MAIDKFGYEIDFLPVGNGDSSGDAIAVRYGYPGAYKVMVVDGGTKESGEQLVEHIKNVYNQDFVDYVINTHPDMDHASGLSVVLENLTVGQLWLHRPWHYSEELHGLFRDGRITPNSLSQRLKDKLSAAHKLEEIANEKGIPVLEPYQGEKIGDFIVLSPSEELYFDLIPYFNKTPKPKAPPENELNIYSNNKYLNKIISYIEEQWDYETLREGGETSYDNESSVILYANFGGNGVLLTGDAGIIALNHAADFAENTGIDFNQLKLIQVPHHGSRNNVSPSVLNRIVGPEIGKDAPTTKSAYISAGKDSTSHPRKIVTNAFNRRGCKVIATQGSTKHHFKNMPEREGWTSVTPIPFSSKVEKYD